MEFTASLDKLAKWITIGIGVLFLGLIANAILQSNSSQSILLASATLLLVYGICWLYRPVKYTVTANELIISRPIGKVIIARQDIAGVKMLERSNISYAVRTFGVGGLFGYFGKFYNTAFGHMTWYVTRRDNPVLITTNHNKKIIVSPDQNERFAAALQTV
jgi:sugar phosphate permease